MPDHSNTHAHRYCQAASDPVGYSTTSAQSDSQARSDTISNPNPTPKLDPKAIGVYDPSAPEVVFALTGNVALRNKVQIPSQIDFEHVASVAESFAGNSSAGTEFYCLHAPSATPSPRPRQIRKPLPTVSAIRTATARPSQTPKLTPTPR